MLRVANLLGILAPVEGIQAEQNQDGCNFTRRRMTRSSQGFLVVGDRGGVVAVWKSDQAELTSRDTPTSSMGSNITSIQSFLASAGARSGIRLIKRPPS
jgi:hypothetical protein